MAYSYINGNPAYRFVDGLPEQITVSDFRRYFSASFPKLIDEQYNDYLANAINTVYTMFYGVQTLWDMQTEQVWYDKTRLCFLNLLAWYIADTNPTYCSGTTTMGGVKLRRKRIGDIDISFDNASSDGNGGSWQNLLGGLLSNPFGKVAYMMIESCAKRAMLR